MPTYLALRPPTEAETRTIDRLAHSRTEPARGRSATVRRWLTRCIAGGVDGLRDAPRGGRSPVSEATEAGEGIAASLTKPDDLGLPFGSWTLDRLAAYLHEAKGRAMRPRPHRHPPPAGGPAPAAGRNVGRRPARPGLRRKKGAIVTLSEAPPPDGVVIRRDEMGAEAAKSVLGTGLIRPDPSGERRVRAKQEADDGRRGKGDVFGAFQPATGLTLTVPCEGRPIANWADFLAHVDGGLDRDGERVYAVLDNLSPQRALDVRPWAVAHPRWELVFPPTDAASLNLIAPWWKVPRSPALNGRRFETWAEVCRAVERATDSWNAHRHPVVWGRRQRRARAARGCR